VPDGKSAEGTGARVAVVHLVVESLERLDATGRDVEVRSRDFR
jgi:hypothetical protein